MSIKDELASQADEAAKERGNAVEALNSAGSENDSHTVVSADIRDIEQRDNALSSMANRLGTGRVYKALSSPVYDDVSARDFRETYTVGNWGYFNSDKYAIYAGCKDESLPKEERLKNQSKKAGLRRSLVSLKSGRQEMPERPDGLIDRSHLKVVKAEDDVGHSYALGYFSQDSHNITLHQYSYEAKIGWMDNAETGYIQEHPIFQANVLFHENVHKDHWVYDGFGQLYDTPVNAARGDRLTETVANAAQYLHIANQYTQLKQAGCENIQVRKDVMLLGVLDNYAKMDKEKRPELGAYLQSLDIDKIQYAEEREVQDILEDYYDLEEENKPPLAEYLKGHGVETLPVWKTETLPNLMNDFVKDGNITSSWNDAVERLDAAGCMIKDGDEKYSVKEYFNQHPEIEKAMAAGENMSDFFSRNGMENVQLMMESVKKVDELAEGLNQPGKTPEEIIDENLLIATRSREMVSDMPVSTITEAWPAIEAELEQGESLVNCLNVRDLSDTYTSVYVTEPVENLLARYPGLKEAVEEQGFDVNNPESVRRVVAASSTYWHTERQEGYRSQMLNSGSSGVEAFSYYSWSEQMRLLEKEEQVYQDVSENMLKDVYIGSNTTVDLSGCRDLLDTLSTNEALEAFRKHNEALVSAGSENEKGVCGAPVYAVSLQEMKAVDAYLTSIGLTTDEQKMGYMAQYLDDMAYRNGQNSDAKLTEILLSYNNCIQYQDGLNVTYGQDGTALVISNGKNYHLSDCSPTMAFVKDDGKGKDSSSQHSGSIPLNKDSYER